MNPSPLKSEVSHPQRAMQNVADRIFACLIRFVSRCVSPVSLNKTYTYIRVNVLKIPNDTNRASRNYTPAFNPRRPCLPSSTSTIRHRLYVHLMFLQASLNTALYFVYVFTCYINQLIVFSVGDFMLQMLARLDVF